MLPLLSVLSIMYLSTSNTNGLQCCLQIYLLTFSKSSLMFFFFYSTIYIVVFIYLQILYTSPVVSVRKAYIIIACIIEIQTRYELEITDSLLDWRVGSGKYFLLE